MSELVRYASLYTSSLRYISRWNQGKENLENHNNDFCNLKYCLLITNDELLDFSPRWLA